MTRAAVLALLLALPASAGPEPAAPAPDATGVLALRNGATIRVAGWKVEGDQVRVVAVNGREFTLATSLVDVAASKPGPRPPAAKPAPAAKPVAKAATIPKSDKPVVLLFTASWCGPCKRLKSKVLPAAEVKAALARYLLHEVDIDVAGELADRFEIDMVPTLVRLDLKRDEVKRAVGFQTADQVVKWLE